MTSLKQLRKFSYSSLIIIIIIYFSGWFVVLHSQEVPGVTCQGCGAADRHRFGRGSLPL